MELNTAKIKTDDALSADVLQSLNNLYSTRAGTQPLDREFGIKGDFVGETLPIYQNQYAVEIMKKTETYEPRVYVSQVTFEADIDGKITPIIHLEKAREG